MGLIQELPKLGGQKSTGNDFNNYVLVGLYYTKICSVHIHVFCLCLLLLEYYDRYNLQEYINVTISHFAITFSDNLYQGCLLV